MPVTFLPVLDAFEFLTKGRFEEYGPTVLSEGTRTMDPRLANNGRIVAIEAAIIPRFISSLSSFQPESHISMLLQLLTRRTRRLPSCHLES